VVDVDVDQLAFAGRLAAADPEAAADLVAFLERAAGGGVVSAGPPGVGDGVG
jgi:hypothetical protein